jgi:hypothetical protein
VISQVAINKKLEMPLNIGWNAFVQVRKPSTKGHFE